jgi:hypothetical protein
MFAVGIAHPACAIALGAIAEHELHLTVAFADLALTCGAVAPFAFWAVITPTHIDLHVDSLGSLHSFLHASPAECL